MIGSTNGIANKANKDKFLLVPHIGDVSGRHLFAVFDGHGNYGKEAAEFAKSLLRVYLEGNLLKHINKKSLVNTMKEAFKTIHESFETKVPMPESNGTTCCTVMIVGN